MGKPAARLTDSTAHGGLIMGPGCPTVLIGKMPAATLGDMHVCPMMTPAVPPIPHVGGPITLGSTGVFIGKKPAARLGDMCVCVGPPSTVIMGCMTVLIGEAGSGSQAGAAGAAAAAQAAKMKGPKALEAFPAEQPGTTGEAHFIQAEFADAGGKPISGIFHQIEDPAKKALVGASSAEGGAYHAGYAKAGGFKVKTPALTEVKWDKAEIKEGSSAAYLVKLEDVEDGAEASVEVYEALPGGSQRLMKSNRVKVQGGKISGSWSPATDQDSDADADSREFFVQASSGSLTGLSRKLKVKSGERQDFQIILEGWKPKEAKEKKAVVKNAAGSKIREFDLESVKPEGDNLALKLGRKKPASVAFYGKSGRLLYVLELK